MKCICMAREMGSSRLVYSINEGDYMELHPTATGKVLLAYAEEEFIKKVLDKTKLESFTPTTVVDKEAIRGELSKIRQQGYALNREGREAGVAAIAAPVFDFENKVPAALAIVGSAQRFTEENTPVLLEQLLNATRGMSRLMGES